jgi:ribosomal protein S18 acetylase RimI-like enzyme
LDTASNRSAKSPITLRSDKEPLTLADVRIRDVAEADFPGWKGLWEQYLVFYETELPPRHSRRLWRRLLDEADPVECLVAEESGSVVGIVHFLPRATTWDDRALCYLEDLFVDPQHRSEGIGESLIRAVADQARERGWAYVYWETAEDNSAARALYDRLTGGASGFITYELEPDSPGS